MWQFFWINLIILYLLITIYLIYCICRYKPLNLSKWEKIKLTTNLKYNSKIKILELEQKLFQRDNILNHVTHEIRTSIHGSSNILQFLHDNWNKIDELDRIKYVGVLSKNNHHIVSLLNDILDLSKFNIGKMGFNFAVMDLLSPIKEIIHNLAELNVINEHVDIIFIDHDVSEALINGDKLRIIQLLNNLFDNALKYTKEGLIIAVIDLKYYENKPYWCFSLIDTGIGIPESELQTIFETFSCSSRTNNSIGTGIGLSICREIVLAHQGYIYAENNRTQGTKLEFLLPVYNQNQEKLLC